MVQRGDDDVPMHLILPETCFYVYMFFHVFFLCCLSVSCMWKCCEGLEVHDREL